MYCFLPCWCCLQSRVLQLETQLRQRDGEVEEALAAASAAGGRDKQVRALSAGRYLHCDCPLKNMRQKLNSYMH